MHGAVWTVCFRLKTRSTIEVAHFLYFVSERRGSLTPNRRNENLDKKQKRLVDSGHGTIRFDAIRVLPESGFGCGMELLK